MGGLIAKSDLFKTTKTVLRIKKISSTDLRISYTHRGTLTPGWVRNTAHHDLEKY